MTKTCKDYIGISLKTLYISIHFGTTLYQKKYMHAPRAVHACTFFNDNVNDDVNDFVIVEKHTSRSLVIVNVIVFVHAFAWSHGSPIASNINLT